MSSQRAQIPADTGSVTEPVREHLRTILRAHDDWNKAVAVKAREIEASGGRIIDGGHVHADEDLNEPECADRAWEMLDWRSGSVIADGVDIDGRDGYVGALAELDPGDTWWHIGNVSRDIDPTTPPTEGVPDGLAMVLEYWVDACSASEDFDELADYVGLSVSRVAGCFRDARER